MEPAKKEIVIAGFLGFFLGLFFSFIAVNLKNIRLQTTFVKPTSEIPGATEAPAASPSAQPISFLIESPEDESVTSKETINLEGKADPQSLIVVVDENGESVVFPNADGSFTAKVTLTPEENIITITTYKDSQEESIQRLVVYEKPEE